MPTSLSELGFGVLSQEILEDFTRRCTFFGKRKIGTFRVLDHEDILAIYQLANH
jgi:hypothetical protein